jgi:hypothetical protein
MVLIGCDQMDLKQIVWTVMILVAILLVLVIVPTPTPTPTPDYIKIQGKATVDGLPQAAIVVTVKNESSKDVANTSTTGDGSFSVTLPKGSSIGLYYVYFSYGNRQALTATSVEYGVKDIGTIPLERVQTQVFNESS